MPFNQLTLWGFKSFIDETILPLEEGLTGIVGPNGCGKSNIVEAIRWVMGENNPRKMRGGGMDDVIFLGTPRRPPRPFAEVALSMSNDGDELLSSLMQAGGEPPANIVIKRRIERGLGSFYAINGREIRQKDAQYLFMDQGSGFTSSALVAQGRLAQLITMKPEERKLLLEEAAGTRSLSGRRHEAMLKLQGVQKNLEELSKIMAVLQELEKKQKKEMEQAQKYRQYSEDISQTQRQLLLHECFDGEAKCQNHHAQIAQKNHILGQLEQELTHFQAQISAQNAKIQAFRLQHEDYIGQESQMNAQIQALHFKRDTMQNHIQTLNQQLQQTQGQMHQCQSDLATANAHAIEYQEHYQQISGQSPARLQQLQGQKQEMEQMQQSMGQYNQEYQALNQQLGPLNQQLSALAQQYNQYILQEKSLQNNINHWQEEYNQLSAPDMGEKEALNAKLHEYEAQKQQFAQEYEHIQKKLEELRRELNEFQHIFQLSRDERRQNIQQLRQEIAVKRAECEAMNRIYKFDETHDLTAHLHIDDGYENILAQAIGDDIMAGLDGGDKAQFWCERPGAIASDLPFPSLGKYVQAPPALNLFLQTTLICDNFAQAQQFLPQLPLGFRLVGRDGSLVRYDGLCQRPAAPGANGGFYGQKLHHKKLYGQLLSQLAGLDQQLPELNQQLAQWESTQQAEQQHYQDKITQAIGTQNNLQKTLAENQNQLAKTQQILQQWHNKDQQYQLQSGQLQHKMAQARAQYPDLKEKTAQIEQEIGQLNQQKNTIQGQCQQLQGQREQQQETLHQYQLAIQELQHSLANIAREQSQTEQKMAETKQKIAEYTNKIEVYTQQYQQLQNDIAQHSPQPDLFSQEIEGLSSQYAQIQAQRKIISESLIEGEIARKQQEDNKQGAEKRQQETKDLWLKLGWELDQMTAQTQQAKQQFFQDYGEYFHQLPPEQLANMPQFNRSEWQNKLKLYEDRRNQLGAVNLLAEQNHQETSDKLAQLTKDSNDLQEAYNSLQLAIKRINREARLKLQTAFDKVNANFKRNFSRLFGGGEAELLFTDNDDILLCGLDFAIRPPGKKRGPLSLLSGGEQTLTALALIFAVMDYNPPPICILDEVDAPLDDTNVARFTQMLQGRIKDNPKTRYLIITHHRLTMAQMDRLYGVTMGEPGVSKLVAVDYQRAAELAESPNKKAS